MDRRARHSLYPVGSVLLGELSLLTAYAKVVLSLHVQTVFFFSIFTVTPTFSLGITANGQFASHVDMSANFGYNINSMSVTFPTFSGSHSASVSPEAREYIRFVMALCLYVQTS